MTLSLKIFKINNYITLKLERGETVIYVAGNLFRQCKYLFINIPKNSIDSKIDSIDDAVQLFNKDMEAKPDEFGLTPEEIFWGHASNLQVWAENEYDSRLLHSNLSFPLLKRLKEAGDPIAKKVYRNEIALRFSQGGKTLREFLAIEGYLEDFSDMELAQLSLKEELYLALVEIQKKTKQTFGSLYDYSYVVNKGLPRLNLFVSDEIPEEILLFKEDLRYLNISSNSLKEIPNWIGLLTNLERLTISGLFETIPDTICELKNLKSLTFLGKIKKMPENLGKLLNLEELILNENELKELPETIIMLKKLRILSLRGNKIEEVPDGISEILSLKILSLTDNPLKERITPIHNTDSEIFF